MDALFCGSNRSGNRVLVQTAYGYVGAEALGDCEFGVGEEISGVQRNHGSQLWRGAAGSQCKVYVEGFDGGRGWAERWLHGG